MKFCCTVYQIIWLSLKGFNLILYLQGTACIQSSNKWYRPFMCIQEPDKCNCVHDALLATATAFTGRFTMIRIRRKLKTVTGLSIHARKTTTTIKKNRAYQDVDHLVKGKTKHSCKF